MLIRRCLRDAFYSGNHLGLDLVICRLPGELPDSLMRQNRECSGSQAAIVIHNTALYRGGQALIKIQRSPTHYKVLRPCPPQKPMSLFMTAHEIP